MSAKDELLNDYERERAERIKRNQAMLAQLKVKELAAQVVEDSPAAAAARAEKTRRKAVQKKLQSTGPVRRSSRAGTAATLKRLQAAGDGASSSESGLSSDESDDSQQATGRKRRRREAVYDPADEDSTEDSDEEKSSESGEDADSQGERPERGSKPKNRINSTSTSFPGKQPAWLPRASFLDAVEGNTAQPKRHKKSKHKHKHRRHKSSTRQDGSPQTGLPAIDVSEAEDLELQRALALSMADAQGQLLEQPAADAPQQKTPPEPPAAPDNMEQPSPASGTAADAPASAPAAAGAGTEPAPSPATAPSASSANAPAANGKAKGSGKGRGRQPKVKPPTEDEVLEAFRQLAPAGRLLWRDVQKAAEQVLVDDFDREDCQNMLQYAAQDCKCSTDELDESKFVQLTKRLYR